MSEFERSRYIRNQRRCTEMDATPSKFIYFFRFLFFSSSQQMASILADRWKGQTSRISFTLHSKPSHFRLCNGKFSIKRRQVRFSVVEEAPVEQRAKQINQALQVEKGFSKLSEPKVMAKFLGRLSSKGFLWMQLAIFVWQAIRSAATLRVPWALISTGVYKIFVRKKFHSDYFVLLSTDWNDTADAEKFCEENKGEISEDPMQGDSSVIVFEYNKSRYICDSQKASQVRLLIAAELNSVPIVKEFKTVNGFMGVWTLCSADEAIRMCLLSKRFRFCFRKTVSLCLIEHMPLITDTYWISKVLSGIPLYLTAKGNEELSSIFTSALIILDFTYNIWVPFLEKAYLMFVRCVQLLLSTLSPNLRFLFFYFLSNFDNRYLPCSISDFKVKIKKTQVFYTTDNTVLHCPVTSINKMRFDEDDISRESYEFQTSAFTVHIAILQRRDNFVDIELRMLDILFNRVNAKYRMSLHNFETYIGCWKLLINGKVGLVQTVDGGLIKKMHLFGFEETIDLFWGSNVNVYEVEVDEPHYFLIAGES